MENAYNIMVKLLIIDLNLNLYIYYSDIYFNLLFKIIYYLFINKINKFMNIIYGIGDWGLGIGNWGLGIGPNPQSPIPNPQSPIPNPHF